LKILQKFDEVQEEAQKHMADLKVRILEYKLVCKDFEYMMMGDTMEREDFHFEKNTKVVDNASADCVGSKAKILFRLERYKNHHVQNDLKRWDERRIPGKHYKTKEIQKIRKIQFVPHSL
jgi:hypothetical protein